MDYPLIAVLGNMGNGKTLFTTFYALLYNEFCKQNDIKGTVFSNYNINMDNYKKVSPAEIIKFPEWLRNGILILDEIHSSGGDAYNFLSELSKGLTTFITQIRKRNIMLIVTSQRLGFVNIRIRELLNYIIEVRKEDYTLENGSHSFISNISVRNLNDYFMTKELKLDLTGMFPYFDTNEIISQQEIDDIKIEVKKFEEKIDEVSNG